MPFADRFAPARRALAVVCAALWRKVPMVALLSHLMTIVLTAGPASADPIRLAEKSVGPPIWCDEKTLVYAGQPDSRAKWPTAVYRHVIPDGPPGLVAKVDGIAVPFHCRHGKILYWTLGSADCAPLRRAVMSLVRNLDMLAPLGSTFPELFLPSPDDRWLAYTVESGGNASNIFDIYLLPLR